MTLMLFKFDENSKSSLNEQKTLVLRILKNQSLFGKGLKVTHIMEFFSNSLPNDKILDKSNLRDLADNKISVTKKLNFFWKEWKTLQEMEKMLVTNIFSLSHNVFKSSFLRSFILSQTSPDFYCLQYKSFLKTMWEKEKLLVASNFSSSHSVFNLFEELSAIFIKFEIVVCKLFQFGRVHNLSFGKG